MVVQLTNSFMHKPIVGAESAERLTNDSFLDHDSIVWFATKASRSFQETLNVMESNTC